MPKRGCNENTTLNLLINTARDIIFLYMNDKVLKIVSI